MAGGGKGKGGGPTTTTRTELSPAVEGFQQEVLDRARGVAGQPFEQFRGPRTAQFGDEFQQGANRLTNIDPRLEGIFGGAAGGLGLGQDFFQNFLGGQGPGGPQFNAENIAQFTNPFQQQNIDATRAGFGRARESGLNTVGDQFTRQGAFGGTRQGVAEGEFAGNLARQEEEAVGGIRQRGFEDAARRLAGEQGRFDQFRGQQLGAAGNLANLGFGGAQGLQNLIQQAGRSGIDIGQLLRGVNQQGIDRQRQAFGEERGFDLQNLGLLQQTLGGLPGQGTVTSQEQGGGSNLFSGLLGLGGTVLGGPIGGFLGSQVGNLFGGGGLPSAPNVDPNQTAIASSPFNLRGVPSPFGF